MEEWKEYKLGEVVNILDYKRVPLSSKERSTRKGIYPYYGAQGIIDYIDDFIFNGTYLLIAEDGENLKSQKQNIAQLATGKYWVNNHAHIVESNGLCDIRYLCYLLNTMDISGYITGSAQPKLNQANLSLISVNLPPVNIQKRIAEFLSRFDDKIEVNRRINDNLEQQAQALFKSWFVDFEPFKDHPLVESELGMIPQGWKVVSLGDLMTYNGGSQPPASEFIDHYEEGYIRFIQIRDYASDGHLTYIPISKRNKLCDVRDIMIARYGASLGRICYGLKGAYNVALAKVTPVNKYYMEYLRCFLNTRDFYEGINNKGNRAVQAGFNQSDIQSFRVAFPENENVLREFEEICSSFFDQRLTIELESRRLAELRDTLLPRLMSGELKVDEVNV